MNGVNFAQGPAPFAPFVDEANNVGTQSARVNNNGLAYTADTFVELPDDPRHSDVFSFLMKTKNAELLSQFVEVMQNVREIAASSKQQRATALEDEVERLILEARSAEDTYKKRSDAHWEAARAHAQAVEIRKAARRTYTHNKYDADNSTALITKSEKAAIQKQLEALNEKLEAATLEEDRCHTRFNQTVAARDAALAAVKAASQAAKDASARLATMTGKNVENSSIKFSTSNGLVE